MDTSQQDRIRGCVVGAAVGDALGMPLEFGPPQPAHNLVREMRSNRLPAGTFTDDTEMALALADSLLAVQPLDAADLAGRFVAWLHARPPDVGNHTRYVLDRIRAGEPWIQVMQDVQRSRPDSAGNGSVMRCWPVAVANWDNLDRLIKESRLQSQVTHPHVDCVAGCVLVNAAIYYLIRGILPAEAVARALVQAELPVPLQETIRRAPTRRREELENSGWVHHTLESALWGLRTTGSFEEAVVQVVNLGDDADTAGAVAGALAGAAYGLAAIPERWRSVLRGEWPLKSGELWDVQRFIDLADRLAEVEDK